jgi:hypothetical protein
MPNISEKGPQATPFIGVPCGPFLRSEIWYTKIVKTIAQVPSRVYSLNQGIDSL